MESIKSRFNLLLWGSIIALFFSCSKDNDFSINNLIGEWMIIKEEWYEREGDNLSEWEREYDEKRATRMIFEEDKTGYVISGNSKEFMKWKLKDNKLSLWDDDEEEWWTYTILELNPYRLVIEYQEKYRNEEYYEKTTMKRVE